MLISLLHGPVDLTLGVPFGRSLSFVVKFFALAQAYIHLDPAALEVNGQGDQGHAILFDFSVKPHDLPLVHQQAAGTAGIHIEAVSMVVGGDVHLVQDHFSVLDAAPGILQVQGTCPDGFDFRAYQFDTGFKFFFHKVFVVSFPVSGHDFNSCLFQIAHLLTVTLSVIIAQLSS